MTIARPRALLWAAILTGLLASCAPQVRTEKGGAPAPPPTSPTGGSGLVPVVTKGPAKERPRPSRITLAIDRAASGAAGQSAQAVGGLEGELRTALAKAKGAEVHRQKELLTVRLRGAAGFGSNSAAVGQGLYAACERVATVLNRHPETVVRVEGHTDSQGSDTYNLDLSRRRAEAVQSLLTQLGIAPSRLEAKGVGESEPVASNSDEAGRRLNRRIEIKVAPVP